MVRTADEYVREILRLEGLLRAFLHRYAPKPTDLDDLLQETYSRLLSVPADQRAGVRNVQAFALTSARHVAVDWIRRKQVVSLDLVEDLDALPGAHEESSFDDLMSTHQELMQIAEVVATLPERCREVFVLRRVYGWSQKEIANRLGITDKTVEQHLVQGMRRCAQLLITPAVQEAPRGMDKGWLMRWLYKKAGKERQG